MLVRTRFIDELMERAVRNGTTQLVILGDGSALDEMRDEEAEAVPGCGDDDSSAEPPGAISSREDDDSHIGYRPRGHPPS